MTAEKFDSHKNAPFKLLFCRNSLGGDISALLLLLFFKIPSAVIITVIIVLLLLLSSSSSSSWSALEDVLWVGKQAKTEGGRRDSETAWTRQEDGGVREMEESTESELRHIKESNTWRRRRMY